MQDSGTLAEAFLEQSGCCSWLVTSAGEFRHIYGDPVPVFGKTASQLVGKSLERALGREQGGIWQQRFARVWEGETLLLRESREGRFLGLSVFPIRMPGGALYGGGLAREVGPWSDANSRLRNRVLGAIKTQDFERRMTAKFLHDKVGQNLSALGLQLDLVRMDLETVSPAVSARVLEMQQLLEVMMEEVRNYSYELNPSAVERAGLRAALDRLASRFRERVANPVRVNVDPHLKMAPETASAMYAIAQEAVENAVQHSSCSVIEIAVKSTKAGPSLEVRDNGRGFDAADILEACRGLGLLSMEHYAAQAGLDLSIKSSREAGTVVRAAAPDSD